MSELFRVQNLSVVRGSQYRPEPILEDVALELRAGEVLGVIGESGCGKTVLLSSLLGMLPEPELRAVSGNFVFHGEPLPLQGSAPRWRDVRGPGITLVFQDPLGSLNPVLRVGSLLREVLSVRQKLSGEALRTAELGLLKRVGLDDAERVSRSYAFQLSGGMRQRVGIALALACKPSVLLADEPTSSLDSVVQRQILDLLRSLVTSEKLGLVLVSHDLRVIQSISDRVAVLYSGRIVESGTTARVLSEPFHPYTRALVQCVPERRQQEERRARFRVISGRVPAPGEITAGCRFAPRCPRKMSVCVESEPRLETKQSRSARCVLDDHWWKDGVRT